MSDVSQQPDYQEACGAQRSPRPQGQTLIPPMFRPSAPIAMLHSLPRDRGMGEGGKV